MTAVVLSAGISSRLRPLTDTLPKTLLSIGGRPLLERILTSLALPEIERVVVVDGYRHEQIRSFVGTLKLPYPVAFVHNSRYTATGNNYSLWLAGSLCSGDEILLLDSDLLYHPAIIPHLLGAPQENVLALRPSQRLSHEEIKMILGEEGKVERIGKEVASSEAAGESLGIERFSSRTASALFDVLSHRKERREFYEASFQELIDTGIPMYAVDCGAFPCMEIDTAEDLHAAHAMAELLPS